MKVLFVCRANVGRSQMAEVIFNSLAGKAHQAVSAGTQVGDDEGQRIGDRPSVVHVLSVLNEIGIDASNNTRMQLTEDLIEEVDVVVSMAEADTLPDFLKNKPEIVYWNVIDPFDQSLDFTRDTRDQLIELVKDLLTRLS